MPTIFRLFGLRFMIFTADHLPPHCHVIGQDGEAKFSIKDGVVLIENKGLKRKDINLAMAILEENLDIVQAKWKEMHGEF